MEKEGESFLGNNKTRSDNGSEALHFYLGGSTPPQMPNSTLWQLNGRDTPIQSENSWMQTEPGTSGCGNSGFPITNEPIVSPWQL